MRRWILTLAAAFAGLAPFCADAALIRVDFTGTNSSPSAINVFGQAVATASGYVVYESDTPATLFSSFNGITNNFNLAIREIGFDLGNGVFTGSRSGNFGFAQVRDGSGNLQDSLSFNNMVLDGAAVTGEPAGFLNTQLTLRLASTGAALSSADLPSAFEPSIFNGQRNFSVFVARASGSQPTGVAVSFNYNLASVSVSTIDEPAGLALAALAAGLLAARRRRAR
jgi:MYXO-CTERM domain-containing protein